MGYDCGWTGGSVDAGGSVNVMLVYSPDASVLLLLGALSLVISCAWKPIVGGGP